MPRRRRHRLNSNNYSSPVDGRLYIEYWIHRTLEVNNDDDNPLHDDPIYIARPNIRYTPPLTKYDAMEYVEGEYNREVRGVLPRPDLIEYTVNFSTSNANEDVQFEPSNSGSIGYAAQIIVKIRTNDHDLAFELLHPPTPVSSNNNNSGNSRNNGNHNATTLEPNNNTKSVHSSGTNEPYKTIKPKGLPFNGGKRRTKKRNMKRKVSRRRH